MQYYLSTHKNKIMTRMKVKKTKEYFQTLEYSWMAVETIVISYHWFIRAWNLLRAISRSRLITFFNLSPGIYNIHGWKQLSQPPPSQPLSSPLKKFLQWNSCDTWSFHMWLTNTTKVNHKSSADNFEVQRWGVRYI